MLGYDREDIDFKSIEFIEAAPRAIRGKPLKELGHWVQVDTALAVKHVAMPGRHLWQFLDRLSFACAYGPNRGSSILVMNGKEQRLENFLCERRDYKPGLVWQKFITIWKHRVEHIGAYLAWEKRLFNIVSTPIICNSLFFHTTGKLFSFLSFCRQVTVLVCMNLTIKLLTLNILLNDLVEV